MECKIRHYFPKKQKDENNYLQKMKTFKKKKQLIINYSIFSLNKFKAAAADLLMFRSRLSPK